MGIVCFVQRVVTTNAVAMHAYVCVYIYLMFAVGLGRIGKFSESWLLLGVRKHRYLLHRVLLRHFALEKTARAAHLKAARRALLSHLALKNAARAALLSAQW